MSDEAAGPVPLTPVMQELAERTGTAARAGSQSMLLVAPAGLVLEPADEALQAVLDLHDVLRARLEPEGSELVIPEAGADDASAAAGLLRRVDAAGLDEDVLRELLDAQVSAAEAGLDARARRHGAGGLFDRAPASRARAALVAHHLVMDGVSWRVLVPDLARAYAALEAGTRGADAGPAGTSFRRWASELAARAVTQEVVGELPAWTWMLAGPDPLLGDRPLDPAADTMAAGLARAPVTVPASYLARCSPRCRPPSTSASTTCCSPGWPQRWRSGGVRSADGPLTACWSTWRATAGSRWPTSRT